jgi:hypothetical protein
VAEHRTGASHRRAWWFVAALVAVPATSTGWVFLQVWVVCPVWFVAGALVMWLALGRPRRGSGCADPHASGRATMPWLTVPQPRRHTKLAAALGLLPAPLAPAREPALAALDTHHTHAACRRAGSIAADVLDRLGVACSPHPDKISAP